MNRNAFVCRKWILHSQKNDGSLEEDDGGWLGSTEHVRTQDSDSWQLVGSLDVTMEKLTVQGVKTILQPFQQTATGTLLPTRIEEIEALGGDPFFLEDDTDMDATLELEPPMDNTPVDENLSFGLLMDLALTSGGVLSRIDTQQKSLGENTRDDSKIIGRQQQGWGNKKDEISEVDEILALGGDPFFLVDNNGGPRNTRSVEMDRKAQVEMKMEQEKDLSPMDILSQLSSFSLPHDEGSATMSFLQRAGSTTNPDSQDSLSMNDDANLLDEIEAMGGDPFFLDIPSLKQEPLDKASQKIASLNRDTGQALDDDASLLDDIERMGGDPSFLDIPSPLRFAREEASKRTSIQQNLRSITTSAAGDKESIDNNQNMLDVPSASPLPSNEASKFLTILQEFGGITTLDGGDNVAIDNDPTMWDEIQEIGGDPSFLDIPDPSYLVQDKTSETMNMLQQLGSSKFLDQEDKILLSNDENLLDEIEAMGGDPSFLEIPNRLLSPLDSFTVTQQLLNDFQLMSDKETDGFAKEGIDWEWDGLVDDDAHMDIS